MKYIKKYSYLNYYKCNKSPNLLPRLLSISAANRQHFFCEIADGWRETNPVSECEVDGNEVKSTTAASDKQFQESKFWLGRSRATASEPVCSRKLSERLKIEDFQKRSVRSGCVGEAKSTFRKIFELPII